MIRAAFFFLDLHAQPQREKTRRQLNAFFLTQRG